MIPKKIHYCWFGNNPKGELIERCIASWKKYCPDYEIIEWNEHNFDVNSHAFTQKMYVQKKWAFVADYARFVALEEQGGWYMDTDMQLVQSLDSLASHDLVLGEEAPDVVSAGAIGAQAGHPYIRACRRVYDKDPDIIMTVPRVMTKVFSTFAPSHTTLVLPPVAFYPYSQETIRYFNARELTAKTYGVHMWNYSWGHPLLRFLNRFPFYHQLKRAPQLRGLKDWIKKILRMA